jgi:hypothetical protein
MSVIRHLLLPLSSIVLLGGLIWIATSPPVSPVQHAAPLDAAGLSHSACALAASKPAAHASPQAPLADIGMKGPLPQGDVALPAVSVQAQNLHQKTVLPDPVSPMRDAPALEPDTVEDIGEATASAGRGVYDQIAILDSAFASEPIDHTWSWRAVAQILETVEQVLYALEPGKSLETVVFDAECRSTLCKLELFHATQAAMEDFTGTFLDQLEWPANIQFMGVDQPDGQVDTIMYLVREGI